MRNFHKVRVINLVENPDPKNGYMSKVIVDNKEIHGVKAVDFKCSVDEVPQFTLEMFGLPDIDMSGQVLFGFTPKTVEDAAKVLQHEFKTNPESRKAFEKSIESVLKELPANEETWCSDLAESIANRIIGIEN